MKSPLTGLSLALHCGCPAWNAVTSSSSSSVGGKWLLGDRQGCEFGRLGLQLPSWTSDYTVCFLVTVHMGFCPCQLHYDNCITVPTDYPLPYAFFLDSTQQLWPWILKLTMFVCVVRVQVHTVGDQKTSVEGKDSTGRV